MSFGPCGTGGLFDPRASATIDDTSISYSVHNHGPTVDWTLGAMNNSGEARYIMDQLTLGPVGTQNSVVVPNLSVRMITEITTTYPDGSQYPLQLGQLALGASNANQSFTQPTGNPLINASLVPGYLWDQGTIDTASYGLHIGSAALKLPLSLWFGGYDQSRVIGPVNALPSHNNLLDNFFIDLLDIGIDVEYGTSPFAHSSKEGLLAEGNASITSSISVDLNPAAPYLHLPQSACAAITKDLPVTYESKYGLYFWDVNNPRYDRIMGSPSYLYFVFRTTNLEIANLTIKVPFQLLNLSLEQPLITRPTTYFPCQPPQGSSTYSLGRAFLQAAFIGVNWAQGLGHWYLAQAPGPNTAKNAIPTLFANTINGSSAKWSDTWKTHWTALRDDETTVTNDSSVEPVAHKLSKGAYVGIGLGCAAAVGAALLTFIYDKRRRRRKNACVPPPSTFEQNTTQEATEIDREIYEVADPEPREIYGGKREQTWELPYHDYVQRTSELE
ncbi:MAG: hypothetical protein Q9221_005485 [Calogaya cf. arnoldii]